MKNFTKLLVLLLAVSMLAGCFAACENQGGTTEDTTVQNESTEPSETTDPSEETTEKPAPEFVDFASQLKFNKNSGRLNVEVTVHAFIDGDTTHFNVPTDIVPTGILKARYLGINTPESTGKIEKWGKMIEMKTLFGRN